MDDFSKFETTFRPKKKMETRFFLFSFLYYKAADYLYPKYFKYNS